MKVVILAGGLGTRLSEETGLKPKAMVEIGGRPILWHIMKIYSQHGFNDFIVCLGYKGESIKEYFCNYYRHSSDLTVDLRSNSIEFHRTNAESWKVTLVDTGLNTMTGGRVKRIRSYVGNEPFLLTYGDGLGDVDISSAVKYHQEHRKKLTVTAVQISGRFGALSLGSQGQVQSFFEKPKGDGSWINGGFFVCQPEVCDYIASDETLFEREPLETLAADNEMMAFKHYGFWKPMDTLRDKTELEMLWQTGAAPWKFWEC